MVIRSSRVRIPPSPLKRSRLARRAPVRRAVGIARPRDRTGSPHAGSLGRRGDRRPARTSTVDRLRASLCAPSRASRPARVADVGEHDQADSRRARVLPRATCSRSLRRGAGRRVPDPRAGPRRCGGTGNERVRIRLGRKEIGPEVADAERPQGEYRPVPLRRLPLADCEARATVTHAIPRPNAVEHATDRSCGDGFEQPLEPSKRRSRCFPTASTDSSLRPSIRDATPVT